MADTVKYNEWFVMAEKDLKSAKILFEHDADNEIVCFHCQQAIEKYPKGYLIYMTKAMIQNKIFGEFLKDTAFVNTYCIETRYPAVDPLIVSRDDEENRN